MASGVQTHYHRQRQYSENLVNDNVNDDEIHMPRRKRRQLSERKAKNRSLKVHEQMQLSCMVIRRLSAL